jgi:hypothetical protein
LEATHLHNVDCRKYTVDDIATILKAVRINAQTDISSYDSALHRSSESAICYRQRLVVSVGNFQRAKHEMFITAKKCSEVVERDSQLKSRRMAPGYRKVKVIFDKMVP